MNIKPLYAAIAALTFATPALALDCESGMRAFAHEGGETCIPEKAERIVSLHDMGVTVALLEFDAPVVGSFGRVARDGSGDLYMRSVDLLMGLDFENSGITYVGTWDAMDYEAIASLQPDLIIGQVYDMEARAKYEAIAPTVFIKIDPNDQLAYARDLADAAGVSARYNELLAIYEANVERARFAFPEAQGASYSKIMGSRGTLRVLAGYGALTKVLEDLGFVRIPMAQEMADRGVEWGEEISVELLPEVNADYIFGTYTIAYGEKLATARADLEELVPGWCDVLPSCAAGRFITLPREYVAGLSFQELNMTLQLVTTNVARNPHK